MTKLSINKALESVERHDQPFIGLFTHGTLSVEFYKPIQTDYQKPHSRDEIYVIASGSGYFVHGDSCELFESGDVFFVPAGEAHRFEDFSDNFASWVFFYGPENGESGLPS
tara:strand:- start:235 stop:567 length:333 start_codon:yes stop_codon:yes gene_type:complete